MRKIYLEYNPYKVETKILVDDVTPKRNSRLQVKDRRLQEWIDSLRANLDLIKQGLDLCCCGRNE